MNLTPKLRKQYNLTNVKPFTKIGQLQHIGTRLQYFYKREDGQVIRHTATVIPYDSPSAAELVLVRPDDTRSRDHIIWDFDLAIIPANRTAYYPL
jgi:hypothetical protein